MIKAVAAMTTPPPPILCLPRDILISLPQYLYNIEDLVNLSSTCRVFRECMATAPPNMVFNLATAQSKIFFRPSPHFLIAAIARQLGNWARASHSNEALFAETCKSGLGGLLDLAKQHCGLTMARIRELHALRFSIINPITDLFDKCVGTQWLDTEDFWSGGVSNPATIWADPDASVFHLVIYGELFAPDLESHLDGDTVTPRLRVETRLEFVKYCIPDPETLSRGQYRGDPRRITEYVGPYAQEMREGRLQFISHLEDNNTALTWVLRSSKWLLRWEETRGAAGADDFSEDFDPFLDDHWWQEPRTEPEWKQRLWENAMVCQGLESLGMILPGIREERFQRINDLRAKVARLKIEDQVVRVARQATHEYPYLMGDLACMNL